MKPTMKDVAKEAGVSQTTVSFVLNDKNLDRIPKETQDKIRKAIQKLNYRVQTTGQSLVTGKTGTIGLLYDETYEYMIHDGFCSSVFLGIQDEIKRQNLRLSFATTDEKQNDLPAMLETHSVDGVIFLAAKSERIIEVLQNYGIPTVLIDPVQRHSTVVEIQIDNGKGAKEAIEHLIQLGHKRIACISAKYESMDYEPISFAERRIGYEKTMRQYNLDIDQNLIVFSEIWYTDPSVNTDPAYRAGYDAIAKLTRLDNPPSAVFVVNDRLSMGVLAYARETNIQIPESLSVVGFDDIPESSRTVPPLTTISVPKMELGQAAVRHLLEKISNIDLKSLETKLNTRLIIRQSTTQYKPQSVRTMMMK